MNPNNYTSQAGLVIQKAMEIASQNGQQAIETGHLLQAILQDGSRGLGDVYKRQHLLFS
jgi:ATP-dependent Clp protease ATP-binding subunit ClpB